MNNKSSILLHKQIHCHYGECGVCVQSCLPVCLTVCVS